MVQISMEQLYDKSSGKHQRTLSEGNAAFQQDDRCMEFSRLLKARYQAAWRASR
jgi:hypothetical protein